MASIAGIVAVRERLAYTMTKFAVVGLTKALALDHSHAGVRFNCICPCRVEAPFVSMRLKEYPDPRAAYHEMSATQLQAVWPDRKKSPPPPFTRRRTRALWSPASRS